MGKNKSRSGKLIKTVLCAAGAYFAANVAIMLGSCKKNLDKAKKSGKENSSVEAMFLQKEEFDIKPDTENIYLTLLSSKVTVNIPKPEKDSMNVEIFSLIGKLNIRLPEGVKINCEGSNHLSFSEGDIAKVIDEYNAETTPSDDNAETVPVINLIVKDHLTSLTIETTE